MKEERYYYSLTFKGSSKYHNSHDSKKNSNEPLTIGETPDCEVRYEQLDQKYEPEYYATILPNEDGKSWRIVKRSPHVDVNIAGVGGVSYVHNLQDGDVITFGGQKQELKFHVHCDENYNGGMEDVHTNIALRYLAAFMILIICSFVGLQVWYSYNRQSVSDEDVEEIKESSIYKIQVDSVLELMVVKGDTVPVDSIYLSDGKIVGTAFLTNEGLLITARHCVEYWFGLEVTPDMSIDSLDHDDIKYIVATANTYNYTHENGDTTYVLRSYCSAYSQNGEDTICFRSDDKNVHINKENDDVVVIDNFVDRYYWPTITPYYTNRKMEMGDILWVDGLKKKGKIQLADVNDIKGLQPGTPLGFLGFPESEEEASCQFTNGKLCVSFKEGKVLMHRGELAHGNSGGPVLIKKRYKLKVIGVVSKVDKKNDDLTKSVPITEVLKGGKK